MIWCGEGRRETLKIKGNVNIFVLEGAARENFFWSRVDRWRAGVGVWEDKAVGWERVSGLIFFIRQRKGKGGCKEFGCESLLCGV